MNIAGSRFQRSGPPLRAQNSQAAAPQPQSNLSQATHSEKDGIAWGSVLAGVGLAAGALTGLAGNAAATPLEIVESETPEVVVLSESIQRIDIARNKEEVCEPGAGGAPVCEDENVAYHPVGVHVGEGVVRDLNGNLFAAPQLMSTEAPGVVAVNPSKVEVSGGWTSRGKLVRDSDGDYETSGSLFGYHVIDVDGNSAEIRQKGLFGSSWQAEITRNDGSTLINERYRQDHILRTEGKSSTVEERGFFGSYTAGIQNQSGSYEIDYPGWLTGSTTVTYNDQEVVVKENGWTTRRVVKDGDEIKVKDGALWPSTLSRTKKNSDGWTDSEGAFWGTSYRYRVEGGQ